ncbi:adhesion G protein-coupled receptor F4 [Polymixia lowei]
MSESWEFSGVFTCTFSPSSSRVAITHKASVKFDVALLPQIVITSEPQFPRCKEHSTEKVAVKVKLIFNMQKLNHTFKESILDSIKIDFELIDKRPRHHKLDCVSWDEINREWSTDGCKWEGPNNEGRCTCKHLSSFAILVSNDPEDVPFTSEITMAGLVISIISLVVCLVTELLVWSAVVKSNSLYIRHTAHINISLSLLFADCVFLASSFPENFSANWCPVFVVLKHFFYLSMFFWMLCLSMVLLRQTVYVFQDLSKTKYLVASYFMGYAFPLFIVTVTFISYGSGAKGSYYTTKGCWLTYVGLLEGSIHTFIIPIGIIIFVNVFSMLVVIFKLLDLSKTSANSSQNQHKAAKNILRSVVILTPIFGVTWIFGFAVMAVDLAFGAIALVVNYTFVLLNAFQFKSSSTSTSFKSETSSTLDLKGKK